jgi:PKD repeat protein
VPRTVWYRAVLAVVVISAGTALANEPPVADAGENQTIYLGDSVTLHGTATDPDGDLIVAWQWFIESQPIGSVPIFGPATSPTPDFMPDMLGDYVFSLMASDGITGFGLPDFVTIHVVENMPPVAVAIADVTTGTAPLTVNFDGTQSNDPEGGALSYSWRFGDGEASVAVAPSHTYELPGTYTAVLRVVDSLGQSDLDTIQITVTVASNIEVSPSEYDFGDVELGSASSAIITITNPAGGTYEEPVFIEDIILAGGGGDFAVTLNPAGTTLEPGESADVGIIFTPSVEGYVNTTLQIASDDPLVPLIEVPLGGVGVLEDLPPEGQIAAILSFVDASVAAGTLTGNGAGNSAENRLAAMQNMIEACGDLIEDELYDDACGQLAAALKKCDGLAKPPDFVAGEAAVVMKAMIEVLRTTLGCQ